MPIDPHKLSGLPIVLLAALLAVAIAAPSAAAQTRTVAVSGAESRFVPNDAAEAGFRVSLDRPTPRQALAVTSRRLRSVINRVRRAGSIARQDVRTGSISVRRVRIRDDSGAVIRVLFRATQGVAVVIRNIRRAGEVIRAGVAAGATGVSGPRFFVSDPDAVYDRALGLAFDRARRKAQTLAARAGRQLGEVVSITERGGISGAPRGGALAPDAGTAPGAAEPPISPGRSRVTATVRVVFELL
jgi:uncharacterized protein YggE